MSSALLAGATGLVGGHLLRLLLDDPGTASVVVLGRRPTGAKHAKLVERVVDLDQPDGYADTLAVDDIFCCLGTTIKKAGSQEAFRHVDLEYPLAIAERAAGRAGQFLVVTAVGADPQSRIFYNRVKGELEQALRALQFGRGVKIFRPSMILGERGESRPAERLAKAVLGATAPLFAGGLKRYRAIDAASVARAMWYAARAEPGETRFYEGASLFALAERAQQPLAAR
jgi:uncharacterized protein YbjT (DUF2867 family)